MEEVVVLIDAVRPRLRAIGSSYRWILGRIIGALSPLLPGIMVAGTSDLAAAGRKDFPAG